MVAVTGASGQTGSQVASGLLLYALSTCGMCKGVKQLLNDLGADYDFIDVDLLDGVEKAAAKSKMREWHPKCPFPMLVINNERCVIGDEPETIKEALGR